MKWARLLELIAVNLRASRVRVALALVGIVVGTGLLVFFVGLGQGLREHVLGRLFPATRLDFEPRTVALFGTQQQFGQPPLDDARVAQVAVLPGVAQAVGKQKSRFPARAWGGRELIGNTLRTEAFFDGLPVAMTLPELATFEAAALGDQPLATQRCESDDDCADRADCRDGVCAVQLASWSARFRDDPDVHLACTTDADCPGRGACRDGWCPARSALRCVLPEPPASDRHFELADERGKLASLCAAGWCPTVDPCPRHTYCAADRVDTTLGWCEEPLPLVINPLMLEAFNTDMARSLGAVPLASLGVLYGVKLHVALGDSFFVAGAPAPRQQVKQGVLVGFSRQAPELGLGMPLGLLRHYNARLLEPAQAAIYDAVLVDAVDNEHVPGVIQAAERLGFQLGRKSRTAQTAGTVVFVVAGALVLLALVVLAVAATQIAQTFAMLVHERRREIAVLRAVGAARGDVLRLVLGEAALVGVAGGLAGAALAWLAAVAVEWAGRRWLGDVPLWPSTLFAFPAWSVLLSVSVASLCCLLGAWAPARRAAALDPARVLAE